MAKQFSTPTSSSNAANVTMRYDIFTNVANALRKRGFLLLLVQRERSTGLCQAQVLPLPGSTKHERIARAISLDVDNEWISLVLESASRVEWVEWLAKQERRQRDGQEG